MPLQFLAPVEKFFKQLKSCIFDPGEFFFMIYSLFARGLSCVLVSIKNETLNHS